MDCFDIWGPDHLDFRLPGGQYELHVKYRASIYQIEVQAHELVRWIIKNRKLNVRPN